jgi:hypothetical protein
LCLPAFLPPSLVFYLLALVLTLSFPVIPKSIVSYLVILIAFVPVLCLPLAFSLPDAHSAVVRFCNLACSFSTFPFFSAVLHCPELLSEAVFLLVPASSFPVIPQSVILHFPTLFYWFQFRIYYSDFSR